jgi:NADPH2:quinone reductase
MVKAVVIDHFGEPDVFQLKEIKLNKPGPGEVLVYQHTIGLNFIDVNQRKGTMPIPLPGIIGCEACGVVEEVGEGVQGIKVGDRVAYATAPYGAYCEARIIDQKYLINVPDYISDEQAAALLLKGMTAHFLLRRTFFVRNTTTVLIHAAAGGVGQLLCVLAKHYGATVIAVVGSDEKAKLVSSLGVDHVINYKNEDFLKRVNEITKNQGVAVVYDSVGKDTFEKSLECVGYFGLLACYGQSSGPAPLLDINKLLEKGKFVTRPSLFTYKKDRYELLLSAHEVFGLINQNVIKANIQNKYKLTQVPLAHHNLESRKTTGQSIIVV